MDVVVLPGPTVIASRYVDVVWGGRVVIDNDLGLGSFVPITEEDRENVRQAKMLHIVVTPEERDAILATAKKHKQEWRRLSDSDHDMRVFNTITVDWYPRSAPSLLDVRVVMAALRAGHFA
jgi:hypothetical protein